MEQLNFAQISGLQVSDVLSALRPEIDTVLRKFNFSPRHIADNDLKDGGISLRLNIQPSNLSASGILNGKADQAGNAVLIRIKKRKDIFKVEFPADKKQHYELFLKVEPRASNGWCAAFFDAASVGALANAVCGDLEWRLLHYPSDFGCCSRYEECSAVGRCIAHDQDMAAGCYYKRNLYNGRIFYNRV